MSTLAKSVRSLTRAGFVPVTGEAASILGTLFDGEVAAVCVNARGLVVAICKIPGSSPRADACYVTQRPVRIPAKPATHVQSATHLGA